MDEQHQETFHQPNDQVFWQVPLPNSNTVLALGIISILSSFWFCVVGLTLGIIALAMASKSDKLYLKDPNRYTLASYTNLKAGRICAIIGTVLSAIYLLFISIFIGFIISSFSSLPWDMMKH